MRRQPIPHPRAFTLLEAMLAVMILAIIAAVVSPIVASASDVYVQATLTRRTSERVGFAAERCIRFIREVPLGADLASVAIKTAKADQLILEDGSGIQFDGNDLALLDAKGNTAALCRNVQLFELQYLATDGVTSTIATPGQTRRINITLKAGGFSLTSSAFVRSGASL